MPYAYTPIGTADEEQVALTQVDEGELRHWGVQCRRSACFARPTGCSEAVGDRMLLPVPHPHLQSEGTMLVQRLIQEYQHRLRKKRAGDE